MNYLPLTLFAIFTALHIASKERKWELLANISKLTLAPLALANVLMNSNYDKTTVILLCISFTFYLIGDAFLIGKSIKVFAIGLCSFLLGHMVFIAQFILHQKNYIVLPIAMILLIYPLYQMFITTKKAGVLIIPMRVYSILMALFISFSTILLNPILVIATCIFTLSDSYIARNVCGNHPNYSDFHIMGTYSLALILLSVGMMVQYI